MIRHAASYFTGFSLSADAGNTFATSPQVTGKAFAANYTSPRKQEEMQEGAPDMSHENAPERSVVRKLHGHLPDGNCSYRKRRSDMSGQKRVIIVVAVSALVLASCSSTWKLTSGSQTPAAQGKVLAKAGPNNNTRLVITVKHLAHPQRVIKTGKVYVVWVRGIDAADKQQNLGVLKVDRHLTGVLDTSTPLRKFELTITVEAVGTVSAPTSNSVLSARISR